MEPQHCHSCSGEHQRAKGTVWRTLHSQWTRALLGWLCAEGRLKAVCLAGQHSSTQAGRSPACAQSLTTGSGSNPVAPEPHPVLESQCPSQGRGSIHFSSNPVTDSSRWHCSLCTFPLLWPLLLGINILEPKPPPNWRWKESTVKETRRVHSDAKDT